MVEEAEWMRRRDRPLEHCYTPRQNTYLPSVNYHRCSRCLFRRKEWREHNHPSCHNRCPRDSTPRPQDCIRGSMGQHTQRTFRTCMKQGRSKDPPPVQESHTTRAREE